MRVISIDEAQKISVENLRLDSNALDLETPEALAAAIRRAAGFLCPCPSSQLIQTVFQSQRLLVKEPEIVKESIANTLESLIAYGDLIEETDAITNVSDRRGQILYLRPPSFVWRDGGSALLLGVAPDDVSVLPIEMELRVEFCNHVRRLAQKAGENLRVKLKKVGLIELQSDVWNRKTSIPLNEAPAAHIQKIKNLLKSNPGTLENLQILNPQKHKVRYYSKRWESVENQSGFFVARRPQLYGNDLWCYVEITNGKPIRMLDFPILNKFLPGRDEAWRLQMAIDAIQNNPQVFNVEELSDSHSRIKFYSPIPTWAQRRLDNLGEPISNKDCLFSYKIPKPDLPEELKFLEEKLWLVREL